MGREIEHRLAAEIADHDRPGIDADAGLSERDTPLRLAGDIALGKPLHVTCAGHGTGRMIRLVDRCTEDDMHRIADELVDGAAMVEGNAGHAVEVAAEQWRQFRGVEFLDDGGKAGEIGEDEAQDLALSA